MWGLFHRQPPLAEKTRSKPRQGQRSPAPTGLVRLVTDVDRTVLETVLSAKNA
jgi:hypothetical protein